MIALSRVRRRFHLAQQRIHLIGTELAAGSVQSDLPALVHVVGRLLECTIRELAADGWEDDAYLSYLS